MTTWEIRKRHGHYVAEGPAGATASLRTHWSMWHAEIRIGDATFSAHVTDRGHRGITVGPDEHPLIQLRNGGSWLADSPAPVSWSGGYRGGVLSRPGASITVSRRGRSVELVGDWPCPELLVMATSFAVMTRHRQRNLTILAIAAATSHGPR